MTYRDLYDLVDAVTPYLRDCPPPVVKQALRRAARQFYRDTEVWRTSLAAVTTVANQAPYTLAPAGEDDCRIRRIIEVAINGARPLKNALYTFSVADQVLTFQSGAVPTTAGLNIVPLVVLWPNETCNSFPEEVYDDWTEAIRRKCLGDLKEMVGVAWSNPKGAESDLYFYRSETTRAKMENWNAGKPGNLAPNPGVSPGTTDTFSW